jgi:Uma2 family endonuclease
LQDFCGRPLCYTSRSFTFPTVMSVNLAKHYNFTVSEYERMGENGIFPPNARVELIEGEIIEMSPIGSRHAACVESVAELIRESVQGRFLVRTQNPIVLDDFSEPQPDIAVLRFRPDRYRNAHPRPGDVLLVIEVAETTVSYDRHVKMPLYARAGIGEALLFNLPDDRLECFARPEVGVYQVNRVLNRGERFESTRFPGLTLDIEMILG